VFQSGTDGEQLRVATEADMADLSNLVDDGIKQATGQAKADLEAQVKLLVAAHAELAAKQKDTEDKLSKALGSLKEFETAALKASDANGKMAQCQKSLVDAVHSGATEFTGCPDPTDPNAGGCGEYPDVDNGVLQGHGTRRGAVRVLECKAGYDRASSSLSGIVTCNGNDNGNDEWSDGKQSRCVATTTTTTTATTTTITTTVYKPWILVYRQKNCKIDTKAVQEGKPIGNTDTDDCFSRLTTIKNFKFDAKFTFKLKYPNPKQKHEIVWSQTSDPTTSEAEKVANYKEISVEARAPWDFKHGGTKFSGLAKSSYPTITYLDGERRGYWFSIGHNAESFPGVPYSHMVNKVKCQGKWDACEVELWVKNKDQ